MMNVKVALLASALLLGVCLVSLACSQGDNTQNSPGHNPDTHIPYTPEYDSDTLVPRITLAGNYPYVFQGVGQSGIYGASPVAITLGVAFPDFPSTCLAYRNTVSPNIDSAFASALARQLGFPGDVLPSSGERTVYSYVYDDLVLEIGIKGSIFIWNDNNYVGAQGTIPTNQECIGIASAWLRSHGLYPDSVANITTSRVEMEITDFPAGTKTTYLLGIEVAFSVAHGGTIEDSAISVVIGGDGALVRLSANAYLITLKQAFDVPLKSVAQAFDILEERLTSPNPPNMMVTLECLINYRSLTSLTITSIELQYQNTVSNEYLLPIYVFSGEGYEGNLAYSFIGKVDAVLH